MTGRPLSENGKVLAICILFPIFWPFIPVVLGCFACEGIRDAYWRWKYRTRKSATPPVPPTRKPATARPDDM